MASVLHALILGLVAPAVFSVAALADPPANPTAAPVEAHSSATPSPRQATAARLAAAEHALEAARAAQGAGAQGPAAKSIEWLSREVDLLEQLDAMAAELESTQKSAQELAGNEADFQRQRANLAPGAEAEKRPYSFLLLDTQRDLLSTQDSRTEAIRTYIVSANDSLDRAIAANEAAQVKRRQAREAAEFAKGPDAAGHAAAELKLAELAAEVSAQAVALRRAELDNARRAQQVHDERVTMLRASIAKISSDVLFSEADLQSQLARIEKEEADAARQLEAAEAAQTDLDKHYAEARKQRDAAAQVTPALAEEVNATKLAHDCQARQIAMLQKRVELLGQVGTAWRHRFAVAVGRFEIADLATWKTESRQVLEQLTGERHIANMIAEQARNESADLNQRLEDVADRDAELVDWIRKEQATIERLIDAVEEHLVKLDVQAKLQEKLLHEIAEKAELHWLARWVAAAQDTYRAVASTEVVLTADDRSVTVGKITQALLMLIIGIVVARWLTGLFGRRLMTRVGIHAGAALALQSLAFYALVVTSGLFALHMVHVPLTAFAFMGGAIAIGVGFGSQKVLNNFISGLILLVEQPIRVGDIIELGALQGKVEKIGTRSTRIRTASNFEIIIPNSSFLENNVVNWTLADSTIRSSIRVGLAYGSPLTEAAALLKQAADAHPQILRMPEPYVLFVDFAENSLNFELFFWVDLLLRADRRRIESDLRFTIDRVFREAGIAIAFPQRDIHLDLAKPIEVALVPTATESASGNRRAA